MSDYKVSTSIFMKFYEIGLTLVRGQHLRATFISGTKLEKQYYFSENILKYI